MSTSDKCVRIMEDALKEVEIPDLMEIISGRSWEQFYNWRFKLAAQNLSEVDDARVEIRRVDIVLYLKDKTRVAIEAKAASPDWFKQNCGIKKKFLGSVKKDIGALNTLKNNNEYETVAILIWMITVCPDAKEGTIKSSYNLVEEARKRPSIFNCSHEDQAKKMHEFISDELGYKFMAPIAVKPKSGVFRLWGMVLEL